MNGREARFGGLVDGGGDGLYSPSRPPRVYPWPLDPSRTAVIASTYNPSDSDPGDGTLYTSPCASKVS